MAVSGKRGTVMIVLFALLSIPLALVYWRTRPSDPSPLLFSLACLTWLGTVPDRSGYDASAVGLTSSVLCILFALRNHGARRR